MNPHTLGKLLVLGQFGSLGALIVLAAPRFMQHSVPALAWLALGLSGLVGLWALTANRPGNFNIHPTPRADGKLVAHGPYRWIRHPMYTAVMLFGLACVLTRADVLAWLLWGVLCLMLLSKAVLEERWMAALHPAYAHYQSRTRWFIPYLL
ncbi:isoprenylcysteine carboxylmethyltransferase family protein [Rhodoferax sp.]|uniref:methyltransferase family protein n=1 Tax=Rhodoferax sp. TaxID=50421 RepID=UPI00261A0863|nr:isoprenylcysteine carboxylmethyltransferase family protein [Rhodoferax sp.]MDD2917669.1 isoprenylcysteine carboxylmethyltransferase family protein [Rhodoferax sp.]